MDVIADLHIHSKLSRATSKNLTLSNIAWWAKRKGIDLVATGDWTHPLWLREITTNLTEDGSGFLQVKKSVVDNDMQLQLQKKVSKSNKLPSFLLSTEISCIYSQDGKGRRIHILVWVPSIASAQKIGQEMTKRGCNLLSDGRPIIGLTAIQLSELILSVDKNALIVPAHIWTPWFSLYGSMSGFESVEEAFGPYAKHIYAIETGLSSSPDMNWLVSDIDDKSIVSFSDAHSGQKLGRELTVFSYDEKKHDTFTFNLLTNALKRKENDSQIRYTIEFYPEEGKYHYSGHRKCDIRLDLPAVKKKGGMCEVCGKALTQGVTQRVAELSEKSEKDLLLKTTHSGFLEKRCKLLRLQVSIFQHVHHISCSFLFKKW